MRTAESDKKDPRTGQRKKATYSPPEIIYTGRITIRAGTPESSIPGVPSSESLPFGDSDN